MGLGLAVGVTAKAEADGGVAQGLKAAPVPAFIAPKLLTFPPLF